MNIKTNKKNTFVFGRGAVLLFVLVVAASQMKAIAAEKSSGSYTVVVKGGWQKGGSAPQEYTVAEDRKVYHAKSPSYSITSTGWPEGFGMIVNEMKPKKFIGKRIRMSAYIKTENVTEWAGTWMRVDGRDLNDRLGFDNMVNRPIRGTTGWKGYEIVLDVPNGARNIVFGLLLTGPGKAWLDDVKFDVVGSEVPTTGTAPEIH